jgi:hypothetical protein
MAIEDDETRAATMDAAPVAARTLLTAGESTGARYQLGETLGRGGMGEVVAAHDTQLGRQVAIKRMRAKTPNERRIQRLSAAMLSAAPAWLGVRGNFVPPRVLLVASMPLVATLSRLFSPMAGAGIAGLVAMLVATDPYLRTWRALTALSIRGGCGPRARVAPRDPAEVPRGCHRLPAGGAGRPR